MYLAQNEHDPELTNDGYPCSFFQWDQVAQ